MATTTFWRSYLALMTASLAGLILIYHETARSLIGLWQSSDTFAHGFIIFPISLYLIWRERDYLSTLTPHPSKSGLAALALLSLGWLIAQSADVQIISQYLFIAMISALTVTLLGWRMARAIAFPLAFTLLAVPFGEIFIRPLIDFTADFTVSALQLTGIPVYREGSHFSLASGDWSVVEACSGLRYLIASFTLGCLYAYLTYRSRRRQLIFVLLSILVPIIANGVRAYLIVLLGHFSGMTLAVGVDHLIYGWLFFGLVMFLLFWAGGRWREDEPIASIQSTTFVPVAAAPAYRAIGLAAIALLLAGTAPLYLHHLEQQSFNPAPVTLSLPQTIGNWMAQASGTGLQPEFPGAAATLMQEYRNGNQVIGIYLAFFRNQNHDAKTVSSQNFLAVEKTHSWSLTGESRHEVQGEPATVQQSRLTWGNQLMLAWQWYWIDDTQTANPYLAKVLQAKQRLTGRGDEGMDVVIFAPYDKRPDEVTPLMEAFLTQASPVIAQSFSAARGMK